MAVGNVKGFRVKKGNETGIAKIATEAYLDQSVTKAKLAQAVQDEVDKVKDKADANGDYDDLTAGGAKQLLSTVYVEDKVPYNFRTSGGTADIGDRMYDEVVGGTIVWNSMVDDGNLTNENRWNARQGTVAIADNIATVTATTTGVQTGLTSNGRTVGNSIKGHKYLAWADVLSPITGTCRISWSGGVTGATPKPVTANVWTNVASIFTRPDNNYEYATRCYVLIDQSVEAGQTIQFRKLFGCDLTQMFGSTIADYIYSLEQGTAGAGVAWFRNLFPKPYYEYNAGELMSVKAGSHDTVGFNQFDKSTAVDGKYINPNTGAEVNSGAWVRSDYIRVFPNTVYYTNADGTGANYPITLFDADKNFIGIVGEPAGPRTFNTGDARYVIISTLKARTSVDDLVLNLSWDGERNGEYEPYEKHTYPLDELELRGIPKLDANNQLYYDGDTYASDGTVTRKYGIVDLGTLNWQLETDAGVGTSQFKVNPNFNSAKFAGYGVCEKYELQQAAGYSNLMDKSFSFTNSQSQVIFRIRDTSYTDTATFKSAMSGVYLVYELAEPTTETADAFTNPQVVNDFGTEEYVDFAYEAGDRDVAIPVGHNSQYMNNLRAKLEMAPDSPSGDGKYIVQQSNGENAYIPYTADGRLDAIEAKLPAPPSANGTYKLTATVTDGEVTYTWVAG